MQFQIYDYDHEWDRNICALRIIQFMRLLWLTTLPVGPIGSSISFGYQFYNQIKVHSHTHSEIWEQANSDMPVLVNLGLWPFAAASLWSPLSEYASPVSLHKHKRCSFRFNSSLETAFKSLCATNTTLIFFSSICKPRRGEEARNKQGKKGPE